MTGNWRLYHELVERGTCQRVIVTPATMQSSSLMNSAKNTVNKGNDGGHPACDAANQRIAVG